MNNGKTIELSDVVLLFNGEPIGEVKSVTASIDYSKSVDSTTVSSFKFPREVELTLTDAEINISNELIHTKSLILRELNHTLDVMKYARHSKKKDKARKKYRELYEMLCK